MSDVRLYVHTVWAVKNRNPILVKDCIPALVTHIDEYAKSRSIEILALNGHLDHLHALLKLKGVQSISTVIQLLKGESAKWANQQALFREKLVWAIGYYARSVDPKRLKVVKNYIGCQEEHHALAEVAEYLKRLNLPENQEVEPNPSPFN